MVWYGTLCTYALDSTASAKIPINKPILGLQNSSLTRPRPRVDICQKGLLPAEELSTVRTWLTPEV